MNVQKGIDRKEVRKSIEQIKCGKAAGMDGINAEMLKYGGESDKMDVHDK